MTNRALSNPNLRRELIHYLSELAADDPRASWESQGKEGLVVGIDQVFHFLFDDHDFDRGEIGRSLLDDGELEAIRALKQSLSDICDEIPNGGDDDFVAHRDWPRARHCAAEAVKLMGDPL